MKQKILNWLINVETDKIIRRSTLWNFVSSMINASYSFVITFFIGHLSGQSQVGIFSLAFAYAYQCMTVGTFGVRNVQASDVKKEYNYSEYFYLRIFSSIAMYLLLVYYTFSKGYSFDKMSIIFLFGIFKSVEAIEDLYHGEYQRYNRLDIGCILQASRNIISMIVFIITLYITGNLILSFLLCTILTTILCYIQNKEVIKSFVHEKLKFDFIKVKRLMLICLPICVSNFIGIYLLNAPKYVIDATGNEQMQSIYGVLILPVAVISLLSAVIYRPIINTMSSDYYHNDFKKFFKEIAKQMLIISVLSFGICVFAYFFGLRLMSVVFGYDYSEYMLSFIIMLIGGGINSAAAFYTIILTIQRVQNQLLIGYAATLILCLSISSWFVTSYGIAGAAWLYLVLSASMLLIFVCISLIAYVKDKGNRRLAVYDNV